MNTEQSAAKTAPIVKLGMMEMMKLPGDARLRRVTQASIDNPVCVLRIGPISMFVVSDPDGARHILQDNYQNYRRGRRLLQEMKPFLGEGLFTSEGSLWLRQRKLAQPAFHRQHLAELSRAVVTTVSTIVDRWNVHATSGETFDLLKEMERLTLSVSGVTLFDQNLEGDQGEIGPAFQRVLDGLEGRYRWPFYLPFSVPTPANLRFRRGLDVLNRHVEQIITQRRSDPGSGADLLALFLSATDPDTGKGMSDRQLRDEVMTMLLAGYETTSVALGWTFYLLMRHPDAEARVRDEVRSVLGARLPTFDDLSRMQYTNRVIQEALRLYPPATGAIRTAVTDDVVAGYRIPAGAEVSISFHAMHLSPRNWERPDEFLPDRFLPEHSANRSRFAYLPFGGGPRQCIGNRFAMMEAQLILAIVLQRYHVELERGAEVFPDLVFTYRPRDGIPVKLRPASEIAPVKRTEHAVGA